MFSFAERAILPPPFGGRIAFVYSLRARKKLYSAVGQRQPRIVADGQSIKGDDGDGVLVILSDRVCIAERIQSDGVQICGAGG